MRIALKITAALVALVVVTLAIEAWLRGLREATVYEQDIRRDQRILGRALERSVEISWNERDLDYARYVLDAAATREREVAVRLVDEAVALEHATDAQQRPGWDEDGAIQVRAPGVLRTYLRVDGPGGERAALELSTSLRGEEAYVRSALQSFGVIALLLLIAAGVAALWLGRVLVGRRVDRLVARAREIGAGDFNKHVLDGGSDELSELSAALNDMAAALCGAQQALEEETRMRLAATTHLRRSDRLATVGTLSAGLAHELGTPVHVIGGRARMIARSSTADDESRTNAAVIVDQTGRVQRIIEALLDFARPRPAERRPVELESLLRADIDMLSPLLGRSGVTCALERAAQSPAPVVNGDPDQLRQVFTNLLLNAGQAMPGGGVVHIELVTCQPTPPELVRTRGAQAGLPANLRFTRVAIRDEGDGIPPDVLPRLFDPFFTTKGVGEGTGLGLAVAHGIISDHGGWIAVESEVGVGSTFLVWLPECTDREVVAEEQH
ncbi:MAG: sensor histidine kinase [Nannocystaceae bacterium]